MNTIKIACPGCGQHIACDETWAGRQIACPTCQQPLVIPTSFTTPASPPPAAPIGSASVPTPRPLPPSAPARSATPAAASASATSAPKPMPVPVPQPAPEKRSGKTSGLAIASLSCSLGTCILGPLGSIPGIILGHMARSRLRRNPSLRGSGLATAGLVIGYLFGVLWAVWFVMFGLAWISGTRQASSGAPASPGTLQNTGPRLKPGPRGSGTNPKPYIAVPKLEPRLQMPTDPVSGRIGSYDFTCDSATLEQGGLTLKQGADINPTAEFTVALLETDVRALSGKAINIGPKTRGKVPQVRALWRQNGKSESLVQNGGYTMSLRFDAIENDTMSGRIDLKLPGNPAATLQGNFIARVK